MKVKSYLLHNGAIVLPENKYILSPDFFHFIRQTPYISYDINTTHAYSIHNPQFLNYSFLCQLSNLTPSPIAHKSTTTPNHNPHQFQYQMGISRFIGDFLQTLGGRFQAAAQSATEGGAPRHQRMVYDDVLLRALITVFGMRENGRIKKEKAKGVVEKLGLIHSEEEKARFELPTAAAEEEEVAVAEVIGEMVEEEGKRNELLWEAFKIFDVDGDGFIDTIELKRVFECLGLDKGWEIREIEKMVSVVDVNLDGKVDFTEFELMMALKCP